MNDRESLDRLLAKGDPESLREAYEYLWACEKGRVQPPLTIEHSDTDKPVSIDWLALERIALQPTPRERLERLTALRCWKLFARKIGPLL